MPFSQIQNKWHFLGVYREGAIGGYAYDGIHSQVSNSLTVAGSPFYTLHIGADGGGNSPYLGVMARVSVFERDGIN